SPSPTYTLSLHDALPISSWLVLLVGVVVLVRPEGAGFFLEHQERRRFRERLLLTRQLTLQALDLLARRFRRAAFLLQRQPPLLRSEEHTSELQSRSDLVC